MTVPSVQDPAPVSTGPYGAMVDAEAASIAQVQQNLTVAVLALWTAFAGEDGSFWRGESVATFARQTSSLVVAAQQQVGLVTEQYLRQQFRRMDEPLPAGRIVDLPRDLRVGTETEEVYQRPVRQVRYLVAREEQSIADAVRTATERLERVLEADIQNAHTTASQQVLYVQPEGKVIGYRRILHPERANYGPVCGLCIVAADRVYSRIEKMATHPGCRCTTLPVVVSADGVTSDPGHSLNAEDLLRLYDAAGDSTKGRDLARLRVMTHENGELGPILMADGAEYKKVDRMVEDLSDRAREQRRVSIARQIDALEAVPNRNEWLENRLARLHELSQSA